MIRPRDRVFRLTCQVFTSLFRLIFRWIQLSIAYDERRGYLDTDRKFDSEPTYTSRPLTQNT